MEITLKKGMPGLEYLTKFKINEIKDNKKFKEITSLEDNISFVVVSPFDFYVDYEINLDDETIKDLDIIEATDVLILNILTLGPTLDETTVNLKAPIVINVKNNLAKQYIIQCDSYETKHPLIRREQNVSNY